MGAERESLLEFPCTFPLKVIGKDEDNFELFVFSIVRRHIPTLNEDNVVSKHSGGGKYLAVTITFTAESQNQLDAMYSELGSDSRVLVLL